MTNASVEKFKKRLARLPVTAAAELGSGLETQATALVQVMQRAAKEETGNLRASIRKERGSHPLQVVVRAGGPLTTVPARSGQGTYDYAKGQEWGNSETPGSPFFYASYRLMKRQMRTRMNRSTRQAIKREFDRV